MSLGYLVLFLIVASSIIAEDIKLEEESEIIVTSSDNRDLQASQDFNVKINGNFYAQTSSPTRLNEDWMGFIVPTTLITNLSIPGTHDTCATFGGAGYKC